jgi:peptidoglycan hydrolase-like protein with peptidoglycan-binding domain
MPLQSNLFKNDKLLANCRILDSAHVTQGATGDHVAKIQVALMDLDAARIDPAELALKRYGQSTAAAVLSFKQKRKIINRAYQSQPDHIVGKMTIAALDKEMLAKQEVVRPRRRMFCLRPPGA